MADARYQKHLAESKLCQNLKSDDGWEEMKPNFLRVDGKKESNKEWIPVSKGTNFLQKSV